MTTDGFTAAEPMVDPETLGVIAADLGADVALQVATIFVDNLDGRVAELTAAQDPDTLRKAAHALRTPAATVGANSLAALCRDIEHLALEGHHGSQLEGQKADLVALAAKTRGELSRLIASGEFETSSDVSA